jgi:hypothetical protein
MAGVNQARVRAGDQTIAEISRILMGNIPYHRPITPKIALTDAVLIAAAETVPAICAPPGASAYADTEMAKLP